MDSPVAVDGQGNRLTRSLRLAACLVSLGLGVEMVTLYWSHPLAFFAFIGLGGLLVGAGVVVYLFALVSYR